MSPDLPAAAPTSTSTSDPAEFRDGAKEYSPIPPRAFPAPTREVVRLFQCRLCSRPFQEAITIPCGRTICKKCLPSAYVRQHITYPAHLDRSQGFICPFKECSNEHALGDCGVDVILTKAAQYICEQISKGKEEALSVHKSTTIITQDPWQVAGISSLNEKDSFQDITGGQLVSTWTLADEGGLRIDAEVKYVDEPTKADDAELAAELQYIEVAQAAIRTEMDCQVCYALFWDPLTTGCGHTFCRACLHRVLDHSDCCPVCRRKLALNPLLNRSLCPSNEAIAKIIENFWWDELVARKEMVNSERIGAHHEFELPLFVATLSFPYMPTFLHVFEPRYRLMLRRCMDGSRLFGMVLPKRPTSPDDPPFHELGTLLRIVNVQYYPDGRSLIETVGISRFRILQHGTVDGYAMANVERIDDISMEQEEAVEAREISPQNSPTEPHEGISDTATAAAETRVLDAVMVDTTSTQALMTFASEFVARMKAQSVPWLAERMLALYGEAPDDPAVFPWWFASILPVKDLEKYRLLGTSSVRDRLKICCSWILEWEANSWMNFIDDRSGLYMTVSYFDR